MVETSDEWILTRTGMKERRIARSDEFTSDMGYAAAMQAIETANAEADDDEVEFAAARRYQRFFEIADRRNLVFRLQRGVEP